MTENLLRVKKANKYDLRFLQRNLIATLTTVEPWLKSPFVFDVDDAIFLGPRGASADRIARESSLIICGNDFLADHFSQHGDVTILPTAVDAVRFAPCQRKSQDSQVIGWSGSSSGLKYLYKIEKSISKLLQKFPSVVLKIICDKPPEFQSLPMKRVIYEPWTADSEVSAVQSFSVGVMPLEDDLWARGKCSFKMLTYMAVGIPVVVSPVGMNSKVLSQAKCGFGPRNNEEWVDAISCLLDSSTLSESMGFAGRKLIEERYSKSVIGPRLVEILKAQI
jgi:glycosyltransferase involved in cell wall biosynthesis